MHTNDPKASCLRLAATRHGVITRTEALERGMTPRRIENLVKKGHWQRLYPGALLIGGAPPVWVARLNAAILAAGPEAAGSHRAAARWHGLDGFHDDYVEVICPRHIRWKGVMAHRGPPLRQGDAATIRNLRVTTCTRTLLDLGSVVALPRLEAALDSALMMGLTSVDHIYRRLRKSRPRRGAVSLERLLESRRGTAPTQSELEREFMRRVVVPFDLPSPVRQFEVVVGPKRASIDFAYPSCRLGIEVLGWRFHLGKAAWERDLARHNRLMTCGWTILYFTWSDVMKRSQRVATEIRRFLADPQTLFVDE